MLSATRIALIAGSASIVIAAGVGAYFWEAPKMATGQAPTPASLAMPPDAEPAPLPAPATSADSTAQGRQQQLEAETIKFAPLVKPYTLVRDSAVYVGASTRAPQMYTLTAGTPLMSADRSLDGGWIISLTADAQAAYLQSTDLGPYKPAQAASDAPAALIGKAIVVDTATLQIDGQQIALAGVRGIDGDFVTQLQRLIDAQYGDVSCAVQGQGYTCTLPNHADLGRIVLFNGIADPTDDASADYRKQADAAKLAHRGHWQ